MKVALYVLISFIFILGSAYDSVSKEKKPKNAQENIHSRLKKMDLDLDGMVSQQEWEIAHEQSFYRLSKENTSAIKISELKPARAKRLGRLDANHDGKLSKEEYLAGKLARFPIFDADGDGFITKEEMHKVKIRK